MGSPNQARRQHEEAMRARPLVFTPSTQLPANPWQPKRDIMEEKRS